MIKNTTHRASHSANYIQRNFSKFFFVLWQLTKRELLSEIATTGHCIVYRLSRNMKIQNARWSDQNYSKNTHAIKFYRNFQIFMSNNLCGKLKHKQKSTFTTLTRTGNKQTSLHLISRLEVVTRKCRAISNMQTIIRHYT